MKRERKEISREIREEDCGRDNEEESGEVMGTS
jgi:hypothetical protein